MTGTNHEQLLAGRYGGQRTPDGLIWNAQVEQLLAHHSVRTFLAQPLPDKALETIVAAAQSASTSSNLHQWSVVAVSDPDLKEQLGALASSENTHNAGSSFLEAPVLLLWVADMSRNMALTEQSNGESEVNDYLDAFLMASVDSALAAQNAAVAAESIGLGVCYIGAMRNRAREVAELVGLPRYAYVTFGMLVGRPDPDRPANVRPRPAQDVVLHHDRYQPDSSSCWVEDYEQAFKEFRTASGMKEKTWREAVATGSTMDYMDGRENLRPTLEQRGFGLR